MPAAEIGAFLRDIELCPGGEVGQHHRGDIRDGVAITRDELPGLKSRVHRAEEMLDPQASARGKLRNLLVVVRSGQCTALQALCGIAEGVHRGKKAVALDLAIE